MRTGIILLLEPGTKLPRWLTNKKSRVETGEELLGKRHVMFVEIAGGRALFRPGGRVEVTTSWSRKCRLFEPGIVLDIQTIERNWHLCEDCGTLTGKAERLSTKLTCSTCGKKWDSKVT